MSADLISELQAALVWIMPAYVANAAPVVIGHQLKSRGRLHPIDAGLTLRDGRRLLGDNKTVEGFLGGLLAGAVVAALLEQLGWHRFSEGAVLSLGALLGDLLGAFIKRRVGLAPGAPAPLLDQLDFVIGATLLRVLFFGPVDLRTVAVITVITPIIHWATNVVAYLLGLKKHPW